MQLEESTTFGILTRLATTLASRGKNPDATLVQDLVSQSRLTHEAFASWTPALALGWSRDDIAAAYPGYLRDFDAMDSLVRGIAGMLSIDWAVSRPDSSPLPPVLPPPYLQIHAAHAVARTCMQSTALASALDRGLGQLALADLRLTERPDVRLAALRRRPLARATVEHFGIRSRLDEIGLGEVTADLVARPALTASMLAPELTDAFEALNRMVFEILADHLASLGHIVLPYDSQLAAGRAALAAAEKLTGSAAGLAAPSANRDGDQRAGHAWRALGSVDAETFSVAAPIPAVWLPQGTPLSAAVAGLDDPHLFLAIRPTATLAGNYATEASDAATTARHPHADEVQQPICAFVRRTVVGEDDLPRVELLDLTARPPRSRNDAPVPVVTNASLSVMSSPLASTLSEFLHPELSTVLVDLPLAPHLQLWMARPGSRVRHVLLRTEGHGRVVPVLLLRVESDVSQSHLMIKPVSHAAARIIRAGFEELDDAEIRLIHDPELVDDVPELLELTLSHLVGEEVRFAIS